MPQHLVLDFWHHPLAPGVSLTLANFGIELLPLVVTFYPLVLGWIFPYGWFKKSDCSQTSFIYLKHFNKLLWWLRCRTCRKLYSTCLLIVSYTLERAFVLILLCIASFRSSSPPKRCICSLVQLPTSIQSNNCTLVIIKTTRSPPSPCPEFKSQVSFPK